MYMYLQAYRREGNVRERRGGGKRLGGRSHAAEPRGGRGVSGRSHAAEMGSECRRVVRERDRVLARRLAVAVGAT